MRKQQREITNHQWKISKQREISNAINDVKQISLSQVIRKFMIQFSKNLIEEIF